jgi:hypothetical protein
MNAGKLKNKAASENDNTTQESSYANMVGKIYN